MSAIRFCVHALGLYLLFCGSFLAAQEGELHRYLVEQLDEVDWSKLEPRDQIQNYLGVSKALMTTGKEELAQVVQGDAISKIESEDDPQFDQMVFEHAIETNRLELAESFARKLNREYITDRLTAAKIRSGDDKRSCTTKLLCECTKLVIPKEPNCISTKRWRLGANIFIPTSQ